MKLTGVGQQSSVHQAVAASEHLEAGCRHGARTPEGPVTAVAFGFFVVFPIPKHSMYCIFTYIGVQICHTWSVWDLQIRSNSTILGMTCKHPSKGPRAGLGRPCLGAAVGRLKSSAVSCEVNPKEIEDARWFSRAEVRQMLRHQHPQGLFVTQRHSDFEPNRTPV